LHSFRPGRQQTDDRRLTKAAHRRQSAKSHAAEYAESARRAKITVQVVLSVAINATGVVDAVQVVKPLEPSLDQNAVEAINKWRFTPATKDGKPVAVQMKVEVGYSLH
jgi:TonB family protein